MVGVGLLVLAALASSAQAQPWQDLLAGPDWPWSAPQTPHPAVARVTVPQREGVTALGSGTLIDVNDKLGLVITNWHVVDGAAGEISVTFPDGFRSGARVLKVDRDWDLAALVIWKPAVKPVPLSSQVPKPGDVLTIAGYGQGRYRAASGRCTQYVAPGTQFPYEMIEVAAAARQGDSGGPIFNTSGQLAGVLFGESGGRTSGSYCGRVHQFLSTISMPAGGLAATSPPAPGPANPPPASAPPVAVDVTSPAPVTAFVNRPVVPVQPREASQHRPLAADPQVFAAASEPMTSTPAATRQAGSRNRFRDPQVQPDSSAADGAASWSDWIGGEPLEQAKTALAVVGAVSLLLHLLRARRAA